MIDLFSYSDVTTSLSVYIGKVVSLSDQFSTDGIMTVDLDGLNIPDSYCKAKASLTLRTAYKAWKEPPELKFKGSLKGKGKISLPSAQLSNINITAGTISSPAGPCPPPFVLTQGTGKIEDAGTAELDVSTPDLEIKLTSDSKSQLPWMCDNSKDNFIEPGDHVLLIAIANSREELYVIDVL